MQISFEEALTGLKNEINIDEFNIWLKDLRFIKFENQILSLATNSQFKLNKIKKSYLSVLEEYFSLHLTILKSANLKYLIQLQINYPRMNPILVSLVRLKI